MSPTPRLDSQFLSFFYDTGTSCRATPWTNLASLSSSPPYSDGPLNLPFQRPTPECRTFAASAVEQVIENVTSRMVDDDLAQLFRNAFPNTLDTTVKWHANGSTSEESSSSTKHDKKVVSQWQGPQTFIVTGDINAEWLRDSTNQLSGYQALARQDPNLHTLILGAINTQAEFVIQSPYCNAFQPPPPSGLDPVESSQKDTVHPPYNSSVVFECKYELDSLASFLALGTEFYENTESTEFLTSRWYEALDTLLSVLDAQSQPTFNATNQYVPSQYRFQRETNTGTETLSLGGVGNPLNGGTGLIRSAFRPSDDATIFGFFIPPNAMMAVQLQKIATVIRAAGGHADLVAELQERGERLEQAVWDHGVVHHANYGSVFAFEVDGYGSRVIMDDANIPSLLSLPMLGFVDKNNLVYQNTRRMLLEKSGNPYYLTGSAFRGIGGPHSMFFLPSIRLYTNHINVYSRSRKCLANVRSRSSNDYRFRFGNYKVHQPRAQLESSRARARVCQCERYQSVYTVMVCMGQLGLREDDSQDCSRKTAFDLWRWCGFVCCLIMVYPYFVCYSHPSMSSDTVMNILMQ